MAPCVSCIELSARTLPSRSMTCEVRRGRKRNRMTLVVPLDQSQDLAEVQVESQHDPLLLGRASEDLRIRQPLEATLGEVPRVVALLLQPGDDLGGHAHIREESHLCLSREDLFSRQPSCVLKGLLNVFLLEVGIVLDDLLDGRALRDQGHYVADSDPHAADARSAAHDLGAKGDEVESHWVPLLVVRNLSILRVAPIRCPGLQGSPGTSTFGGKPRRSLTSPWRPPHLSIEGERPSQWPHQ